MDGNIRSAPLADRFRMVQVITDCRSLNTMLATFRVRFRGSRRFSEYDCVTRDSKTAVLFYRVKIARSAVNCSSTISGCCLLSPAPAEQPSLAKPPQI